MQPLTAKQHFQAWVTTPNRHPFNPGGGSKDLQTTVEEALWEAYQEGYRQCKQNVEAAIAKIAP